MQITRARVRESMVWLCRVRQKPAPVRGVCSVCRRALTPIGLGSSKAPQRFGKLGCWKHSAPTEFGSPITATWRLLAGPPRGWTGGQTLAGRWQRCERYGEVGLIYVDGGQHLMIPVDHPHEPILDAMVVAHMLDLPGCVPELAGIGPPTSTCAPATTAENAAGPRMTKSGRRSAG